MSPDSIVRIHPKKLPEAVLLSTSYLIYTLLIFFNNAAHFLKLLFHLFHQSELGSGANQIVLRISSFKVNIPLKKIHQETNAAFIGH